MSTEKRPAAFIHLIPIHHEGRREFDVHNKTERFGIQTCSGLRAARPRPPEASGGGALQSAIPQSAQGPSAQSRSGALDVDNERKETTDSSDKVTTTSAQTNIRTPQPAFTSAHGRSQHNVPEKASGSRKQPPYQGPNWARASKEANQRPDSTTELTSFGERMCKKRTALAPWTLMIRAEAPPFKLAYPVWIGGSTTFVGALCNNC